MTSLIIEADGGSRGNPGPAGYGAVVLDARTGAVLAERSGFLGTATNNVAEYRGVIAGLEAAVELGGTEVEARLDSKLVVEQLSGRWQVKHPQLQPLARRAAALVRQLPAVRFTWVPRARNTRADRLANVAMDAGRGTDDAGEPEPAVRPAATPPRSVSAARTAEPAAWRGGGPPTRLLLLRHGQTEHSASRRYSGRGDLPLTDVGEEQAGLAAKRLAGMAPVAAVVSSPLLRAVDTAQRVADACGVALTVHPGLIEADFGAWEGLTFAEVAERDPALHARWLVDTSVDPPGGESLDAVHRRARRARDELIAAHGAATVVVVSHVTPIKAILRMALDGGPAMLHRLHLDLASLSIAEFAPDGSASVTLVNDTSHLG